VRHTLQTSSPGPSSFSSRGTITGPNTVWWFNGQNPDSTDYPVSITLTSSAGAATSWSVSQPDSKVTLSPSGTTATLASTGSYFSGTPGDVSVYASANGKTSAAFTITSKTPWRLVLESPPTTDCDGTFGYITFMRYDVHDNFDQPMPSDITWNEFIGTAQSKNGSNWGLIGITTQPGSSNPLIDQLAGPRLNYNPAPNPTPICRTPPSGAAFKELISQAIRVGSVATGVGVLAQSDTLTYYIDHGNHTGIVVPAKPPQ
jgi:hypothetical protein